MNKLTFLFLIAGCFCSCTDNTNKLKEKVGLHYNSIREKLHLVPVEPTFKFNAEGLDYNQIIFLHENEIGLTKPAFLRKHIALDSTKEKISWEEDHFKNPAQKMYLISTHFYYLDSTRIIIQAIQDVTYGNSKEINNAQADSIIRSWNIAINPFKDH